MQPAALPELHQQHEQRHGWHSLPQRPWWPWLTRGAAAAFFVLVAGLLFRQARTVDWPAVLQALRALPPGTLAVAGALALASHCLYGTFDLVARHCCGHHLRRSTTLGIAMTSYAFTLNLGSFVGGVGVRYRLYARRGVDAGTIGQVVGTSVLTNWVGYLLLAAVLPWLWAPPPLAGWSAPAWQWRLGGALLGCIPLAYGVLCALRAGVPSRCGATRLHCRAGPWPCGKWLRRPATGC